MTHLTAEELVVPGPHDGSFSWRCPEPSHELPLAGLFDDRHLTLKLAQAHLDEKHTP